MAVPRSFQYSLPDGLVLLIAVLATVGAAHKTQANGDPMSYGETRNFLNKHTNIVELTDNAGARVAIAPAWQGRVMTSTCGGLDGPSFGFVNRDFIEAGQPDPHFNNYGAEERVWLCPEGGQFSLWFKPGAKQVIENWYTPPALNEGPWKIVCADDGRARPSRHVRASGVPKRLGHKFFAGCNPRGAPTFRQRFPRTVRRIGREDRCSAGCQNGRLRNRQQDHQSRPGLLEGKGFGFHLDFGHDECRPATP